MAPMVLFVYWPSQKKKNTHAQPRIYARSPRELALVLSVRLLVGSHLAEHGGFGVLLETLARTASAASHVGLTLARPIGTLAPHVCSDMTKSNRNMSTPSARNGLAIQSCPTTCTFNSLSLMKRRLYASAFPKMESYRHSTTFADCFLHRLWMHIVSVVTTLVVTYIKRTWYSLRSYSHGQLIAASLPIAT